jgi:hypothetical protein
VLFAWFKTRKSGGLRGPFIRKALFLIRNRKLTGKDPIQTIFNGIFFKNSLGRKAKAVGIIQPETASSTG